MSSARTMYIVNPSSGSGTGGNGLDLRLAERDDLITRVTTSADDAILCARHALDVGIRNILVAGGDGTLNRVLQGIAPHFADITIGVVPAGTGNDYARTLGIPLDPKAAIDVLLTSEVRRMDVGQLRLAQQDKPLYFLNASTGGFSGQVGTAMTPESKSFWGPFAYLSSAIESLTELRTYSATVTIDSAPSQSIDILNMVIAHGKTVGGGTSVAPWADPADGKFEVVIIPALSMTELALEVPKMLTGTHRNSQRLFIQSAQKVRIDMHEEIPLNVDGEMIDPQRQMTYEVLPSCLRVFVPRNDSNAKAPGTTVLDMEEITRERLST